MQLSISGCYILLYMLFKKNACMGVIFFIKMVIVFMKNINFAPNYLRY